MVSSNVTWVVPRQKDGSWHGAPRGPRTELTGEVKAAAAVGRQHGRAEGIVATQRVVGTVHGASGAHDKKWPSQRTVCCLAVGSLEGMRQDKNKASSSPTPMAKKAS